ncbi:hypothetical protein MTR_8g087970 [Medicago truncatula]|uniref:Uncharacterized protein n=1 Tax=Medicago truncatula TaxID=3880 RepID=G7L806_MEDTR|nr:hypothetical protein MTR_8g087970 [Medicago truncatula]
MAEVKSLFVAPNKQKSIENEENVIAILLVKSGINQSLFDIIAAGRVSLWWSRIRVGACRVIAGAVTPITHNVGVFATRNNGFGNPLQISFSQYQITDALGERFTNHKISRL